MVDWDHPVFPVSVQAQMLSLNRSSLYYRSRPISEWDMQLNRLIDITYTKHPEFGHRRIAAWLGTYYGFQVERKTVLARMREMGIQAIYPRQSTSRRDPSHKVYLYLLKDVSAAYPDHVWSIDITYIPIQKSWLYLTAIIDWYFRYVMAWETGCLISMDHRGRAYDNIFIERFWRSLKYEDIYLKDYQYPREARKGIYQYLEYYNNGRLHQSLGYRTPASLYYGSK